MEEEEEEEDDVLSFWVRAEISQVVCPTMWTQRQAQSLRLCAWGPKNATNLQRHL